ncbi:DUF2510 domain-containing protein [Streptomyces sp. SID13726]|uniref:DUF2510 domain-containing protein n=1 Tax=Streptomyces sp. SID13726 TaxID=2706058 RepID=UPI0013B60409|nr:DUF2510 domain-containing protein [Streptomyces sp. SID13726]NEB02334.1 DUF2510 domain-containing protein [Streptomyces sp. SID13726]
MSRTLPPGWYPDPDAPHLERRWDGTAWTDDRRAPEAPGPPRAADGASGRAKAVALAIAGAVLVPAIVTGAYALARGHGDDVVADTAPTFAAPPPTPTFAPPPPTATSSAPTRLVDELDGISLPLPEGWVPARYVTRDNLVMTREGGGRVFARTVSGKLAQPPDALAEKDIPQAADTSYDGIRGHHVVRSERVKVAGCAGYLVRWRVRTAEGPGGYVQSLAFARDADERSRGTVVVRFAFDAGPDGPPLADMDRITRGIRSLDR